MEAFRPPGELNFEIGNVSESWKKWEQKLGNYMLATDKNGKPDRTKIAILLNLLGDEGVAIFNTFQFEEGTSKEKFDDVLAKFRQYCTPRRNVVFERYKFFTCVQLEGQSVDSYLTQLRTFASSCEFETQTEGLIRDRIVLGIRDAALQERLLREPTLTLKKAVDFIRASEISKEQIKSIQVPNSTGVHAVYKKQSVPKKNDKGETYNCKYCGRQHKKMECPAYGKLCNKCKQKNHFALMCHTTMKKKQNGANKLNNENKNTQRRVNEIEETNNADKDIDDLYINSVRVEPVRNNKALIEKEWLKKITVEEIEIEFKLDTGAETNILPLNVFKKLSLHKYGKLMKTDTVLVSYGNFKIKPEGQIVLNCSTDKMSEIGVNFDIVDVESKPILGLPACKQLSLVQRIDELSTSDKSEIVKHYEQVFQGLGKFPGKPYHIELKDVEPVVNPPRRVPQSLHDSLKKTLDQLEKEGIVSQVSKPTEWVNSLVVVEKPNGKLRICLDPRNLNQAIKREHHMIPSADDIISRLEGKQWFSVLDLKDGFWQVPLDEESAALCTFNSPFGRYQFNRMPFGIASAPEVFQKRNHKLFGDIPGVEVYFDDLIVTGTCLGDHDNNLTQVLQRASEYNVKFNEDKFQFRVPEVRYMGQIISKEGVKADPSHVKAIKSMEKPVNKSDVRRFLGMVNFLSKFLPNASTLTAPLRELIKQDTEFIWSCEHEEAFGRIKDLLSTTPVLKVFNSSKEIIIQCDSSKDGLGSCLIQEEHPVSFVSRSLTGSEKNYAQIEKELLSIVYSFEKFHNFVYGRKVIVQSDHKPLMSIVNKPISKISTRLQRMLLKLLKYNFIIQYVPGSQMYLADTLSRAYLKDKVLDDPEMLNVVHNITKHLPMSEARVNQFREALKEDEELKIVSQYCREGWPEHIKSVPVEIRKFWKLRSELVVLEELLFLNNKVVVPQSLREEMLQLIHEAHFGMEKCKNRARDIMYWPGMSTDIEKIVSKCETCEKFRKAQPKEPLYPHAVPERPFEKVGIDLMELKNSIYLVLIDYFSKWIEVVRIRNKSMEEIIPKLKLLLARFGVPDKVVSDNNPFNSHSYKSFAKEWGFETVFISPRYSQSNGMVEKAVGISKLIFKKADEDNKDPTVGLMEYRNTPISGLGLSPAQMMFNRRLRTKLPINKKLLNAELFADIETRLNMRQEEQRKYYDRTAKPLEPLNVGDNVCVRNMTNNRWEPAKVIALANRPRSYVVKQTKTGQNVIRNRRHLLKSYVPDNIRKLDLDENWDNMADDENSVTSRVTSPRLASTPHQAGIRTRSGRISRRPPYLRDFIT